MSEYRKYLIVLPMLGIQKAAETVLKRTVACCTDRYPSGLSRRRSRVRVPSLPLSSSRSHVLPAGGESALACARLVLQAGGLTKRRSYHDSNPRGSIAPGGWTNLAFLHMVIPGGIWLMQYGTEAAPECCDGCGQAADQCGMVEHGWTVRTLPAGFAGSYCRSCAAALHLLPWSIRCFECGLQKADEGTAERAGFRFYFDGVSSLVPYCGDCALERR